MCPELVSTSTKKKVNLRGYEGRVFTHDYLIGIITKTLPEPPACTEATIAL
jgi:hypothetical protein